MHTPCSYLLFKHKAIMRAVLHIDHTHNWIGATSDGIVNDPNSVDDPHGVIGSKTSESTSVEELCGKSKVC